MALKPEGNLEGARLIFFLGGKFACPKIVQYMGSHNLR
jgi:hypothetical protein